MQRTLVLLKPDAVQRGKIGEIVSRLERRGLKFVAIKLMLVSDNLAHEHYAEHVGKPFFDGLVRFITSSPIIAMVVEGENAVELVRTTMGATNPQQAAPGTIRGDLALSIGENLIHGSDSPESAAREIALYFSGDEIVDYTKDVDRWVIES
jgi:nucleoside-diphosphate kinase